MTGAESGPAGRTRAARHSGTVEALPVTEGWPARGRDL